MSRRVALRTASRSLWLSGVSARAASPASIHAALSGVAGTPEIGMSSVFGGAIGVAAEERRTGSADSSLPLSRRIDVSKGRPMSVGKPVPMTDNTDNTGTGAGIPAPPDHTTPMAPLPDAVADTAPSAGAGAAPDAGATSTVGAAPTAAHPAAGAWATPAGAAAATAGTGATVAPESPKGTRRWGVVAGITGGGVLALALALGGGVALGATLNPGAPAGFAATPAGASGPSDGSGQAPGEGDEDARPPFGGEEDRGGRPGFPGEDRDGGPRFGGPGPRDRGDTDKSDKSTEDGDSTADDTQDG